MLTNQLYPLIDFGSFPVYNLMVGIGIIAAVLVFLKNMKSLSLPEDRKEKMLFTMGLSFLPAAALANIGNWFIVPGLMELALLERIFNAGFTFYFGMIGYVLILSGVLKLQKFNVRDSFETLVPSLPLFHAFGRIGCMLGGCCYGLAVNWNILGIQIGLFPVRELEFLSLMVIFLILQFVLKKNKTLFYFTAYPIVRLFLEFGRGDYRGRLFGLLSVSQEISILILLLVWGTILVKRVCSKSS